MSTVHLNPVLHLVNTYWIMDHCLLYVSDVEYHFLPGEHHLTNIINVEKAFNFSLNGIGLSPASLVCRSQSYVGVFLSYNVTITNLVFDQCNGVLLGHITAGLILHGCFHCKVENIYFLGYRFVGINLFLHSYIYNITINLDIIKPGPHMCRSKFILIIEHGENYDLVSINHLSIGGYNDMCYEYHEVMLIQLHKCHGMQVELCNSQFHYMNQMVLRIEMEYSGTSLVIKNCIFMYISPKVKAIHQIFNGRFSISGVAIKFENCSFYYIVATYVLGLQFVDDINNGNLYDHDLCVNLSKVTIENCDFIDNIGSLLDIHSIAPDCKANLIFKGTINFTKNKGYFIMYSSYMSIYMNGTITMLKNNITFNILELEQCEITVAKTITFLSNVCGLSAIMFVSMNSSYIRISNRLCHL